MFPFMASGGVEESPPPPEITPSLEFTATGIATGNVDISSYGFEDYHKALSGNYINGARKTAGGNLISVIRYDEFSAVVTQDYENKSLLFSASDSTPTLSGDGWVARMVDWGSNANKFGFTVTFPADTGLRTAKIWCMNYANKTTHQFSVSASLGDSSATPINQSVGVTYYTDNYILLEFSYRALSTTTLSVNLISTVSESTVRAIQYTASGVSPSVP
jgi:hypothetical protein